jgi:hypothetical protein
MSRTIGKGQVVIGDSLSLALTYAGVEREPMAGRALEFTRRSSGDGRVIYMIRNNGDAFDGWVGLNEKGSSVLLYDPMTGSYGKAQHKADSGEVRLQLSNGQLMIVTIERSDVDAPPFGYITTSGAPVAIGGTWSVTFEAGGPSLPRPVETDTLGSWTYYNGDDYREFSGTAVYRTTFALPGNEGNGWMLDLGDVRESARVILNGKEIAVLISPPFRVKIEPSMAQEENVLEVRVTNLMANRIAGLDKKGVKWRKFYNINFPARREENRKDGLFDASKWPPRASGLIGPVQLLSTTKEGF